MAVPYPSTLPSPLYQGKLDLPTQGFYVTPMDYATKRRPKNTGQFFVNITFLFTNDEVNTFNEWYILQLNNGAKLFEATWDIAGAVTLLEYAIADEGQPQYLPRGLSYEVKLKLEIKSDIVEILARNNLNGFCPDIINCQIATINLGL